jgi:Salmonella virulence plasmid 65kDa B protein
MKSWVEYRRVAAGVFVIALFGLCSHAEAAVGRTVGTYQVSSTGAATYGIPIWAPRGPNNLEPHVTLAYSSQSGIGYLGVGWSLSGLSSIYRCTQTYAQDPAPAPVALAMSDVFCMDGQRLRLTGGTYGDADSTYQTEVANFANVTAYGSAGKWACVFRSPGARWADV